MIIPVAKTVSRFVVVIMATLGLAACSDEGPGPAATALASGLTAGDLSTVTFTPSSADPGGQLTELVAGMGGVGDRVSVVSVSESGSTATATLSHRWTLAVGPDGPIEWTYTTTAALRQADDGWLVQWSPSIVADLAAGEVLSLRRSQAPRALVLGDGAVTIVANRPVVRFGIDRGKVDPAAAAQSAHQLATLLGVAPEPFTARVDKAGPRAFVEALVIRADEVPAQVNAGYPTIAGAVALRDEIPLAPTRDFARPVLGTVGPVTAELIAEQPGRYGEGDQVGLSGLQRRYDDVLGGTPGVSVIAQSADGSRRTVFEVPEVDGRPLTTTLSPPIQTHAEQLLAGVGPPSAIVVIRPSTGEVLAAASGPGGEGYSTATLGRYAPGSTFKIVTALALLRSGLTPDSAVSCPPTITVDGRVFSNYSDFPTGRGPAMTLREAVALSCNTAFLGAAEQLSPDEMSAAAASLGLCWQPEALGAAGECAQLPVEGSRTELAAAMIGQGAVTTTPLAMATVIASVQHGATVTPRLVTDPAPPGPSGESTLTPSEAAALASMLGSVVSDGTGSVLAGAGPGGTPVIAKTGTAEFGTASPPSTHAWTVAAAADLAAVVFVEEGSSGAGTAGPIMRDLLVGIG